MSGFPSRAATAIGAVLPHAARYRKMLSTLGYRALYGTEPSADVMVSFGVASPRPPEAGS
jgi:hypothetical protein